MTSLIDTHCHLDAQYFPDSAEVIGRANAVGVDRFVVIGVGKDLAAARAASALAKKRDDVAAAVGIHPHDAKEMNDAMLAELSEIAKRPEVVAVGEIGLDYHYNHSEKSVQQAVFARLIALAREVKKPIVIHTRSAPADTLDILEKEGARDVGGIIHCFSEDWAFATRAMDLGFDLSFSGIVTFKTATSVHDVAKRAPADRIHVETDSPYLAPIPLRGKKCEPAYIVHTAKRVAELRGTTLEALAPTLRDNVARRLGLARWVPVSHT
jgi:TatD DNase family protein